MRTKKEPGALGRKTLIGGNMADDALIQKGIRYLMSRAAVSGASSVRVKDGQIFFFTLEKLLELAVEAEAKGKGGVVVFVKSGGSVEDLEES
jgi:hypothetical protein